MTTATDPFVAILTQRMIAREAAKRKPDYSPGLAPDKIIDDLKREEAEREERRRQWRDNKGWPGGATIRPDYADDIDAMVAQFVAEGWLYLDAKADEYRARDRRWREMTEEEKSWRS